jgi:nicotinamidase-related amidase
LPADYYQQFDADYARDVPGEGYGGWKRAEIEIAPEHTAVVVMHAWDCGTREQFPGWYRCVEGIPRATEICRTVMPPLLAAVRRSGIMLIHVVSSGSYAKDCPGYQRAVKMAGPTTAVEQIPPDPVLDALQAFKREHGFVGTHNQADVAAGFKRLDFAPETRPVGDEGVAENAEQLFALCKPSGINHLIYAGFAVNWCLLMSPGGMLDMKRRGFMCSALRQAVSAVENKETARREFGKEMALWRVSVGFGFVFNVDDFIRALDSPSSIAGDRRP